MRHLFLAPLAVLSAFSLNLSAQVITPPFVQNGTVVTTPATGTFTGATFMDTTTVELSRA